MEKSRKTVEPAKPPRIPYRQPKLRAYGSIQSITQARTKGGKFDGAGGGGKTFVI